MSGTFGSIHPRFFLCFYWGPWYSTIITLIIIYFHSLLITLENSPYYAEIMRGHYFSDHNRFRIRRALSLRHRPTSHHPRHQLEDRQSNVGSLSSRIDSGRTNLSNVRAENFEPTILVDDVSND
jgi:hypothetical protein